MYLAHLRLRNFRNYEELDVDLTPGFHLFLGQNGQGKTNLLEAVYLLSTLRSFRGAANPQLVRQGQAGYFVGADAIGSERNQVKCFWSAKERRISVDGRIIRKTSDYFGLIRVVVFCSEDMQLIKGAASRRRRFLDLLLAQTRPAYLPLLQRYMASVRARNALLKQKSVAGEAMQSFTREMIASGIALLEMRKEVVPKLSTLARLAYRRISRDAEELGVEYHSTVRSDFAVELAQSKARESVLRATMVGPHRDDIRIHLNGRTAGPYASEGQKRSIAIALKMAQAEFLTGIHGVPPILLIDDVMGELDAARRSGFMPLLNRAQYERSQVYMTATESNWPEELSRDVARWEVRQGQLRRVQ